MSPVAEAPAPKQNIFDMRLQSARANLDALNSSVESIKARNTHLSELWQKLVDEPAVIEQILDDVKGAVERAKTAAETNRPMRRIISASDDALESLKELGDLLAVAKEKVTKTRTHRISPDLFDLRNMEFDSKVRSGTSRLQNITDAAKSAARTQWEELKMQGALWGEYLDYLAGLSLRHDGLDDGVCSIADKLIVELQQLSQAELAALAIPGRDGCDGILPKIVYLRLPEWTVWALPLAAHELWHIVEENKNANYGLYVNLEKEAAKRNIKPVDASRRSSLRECLADVFATFTMGPAYALSSMVLALDPAEPYRARCIFRVLEHLAKKETHGALQMVLDKLAVLWRQATQEAGVSSKADPAEFDGWTDALIQSLDESRLIFPTESWVPSVEPMVEKLMDFRIDVATIDLRGMSLRLALSAAWRARLDSAPGEFTELTRRCAVFCIRVRDLSRFDSPPDLANKHNFN